jgi:hypothetical protein
MIDCYVVLRSINMNTVLKNHPCQDLCVALSENLPFKIPTTDLRLVQKYPDVFEHCESNIEVAVRGFMEHTQIGHSETTIVIIDSFWLNLVRKCVNAADVLQNEHDASSTYPKRPDTSVQVRGALALKGEAKFAASDLTTAFNELTSKFHRNAYKVFPKGSNTIVGITSCIDRIQMNLITFSPQTLGYTAQEHEIYNVNEDVDARVKFLVDMLKVCRWMASISCSNTGFHLTPGLRKATKNGHHITWTTEGIFKEFDKHRDMSQALSYIQRVYHQNPPLMHVEHGRVCNFQLSNQSIVITRIGNRLTMSNMIKFGLTKEMVISQTRQGLEELHTIGLAHCDISVDNVFIDDNGVVFLDDLEYLTPTNDPPPHFTRLPVGVNEHQVQSALQLDEFQFQLFCVAVNSL